MNNNPEIVEVSVADIKPSPYNPRSITKAALEGLTFSLDRFGIVSLIIVNRRNMRIIGGHQRFSVIKDRGLERIPVVMVDVDDETEKAMNISLNNPNITGRFTDEIVAQLETLKTDRLDDVTKLRFDEMLKGAGMVHELSELTLNQKDLDLLPTQHKCPGCGYEW